MARRQNLESAYRATSYQVDDPAGRFNIRIGGTSAALDRLLLAHNVTNWAFITAYNPGSEPLPEDENVERQRQLELDLRAAGYVLIAGAGVATGNDWPPEPSFLILGIDVKAAQEFARRYGQYAWVSGSFGESARLIWADD